MNFHPFLRAHGYDLDVFPTPGRQPDVLYPDLMRPCHGRGHQLLHGGAYRADINLRGGRAIAALGEETLAATGDLGWTLDYATAWLYRYLERSRPIVSDAIDHLRVFDCIVPQHALYFFDHLDTKVFGGKLKNAVCLRWRPMPSCSPGTTSAPNVIPGVARVCIDLNKTPFTGRDAGVDELLEALIHHMIHAYFLVCCGAQKTNDKQDGRLMDGLHFGVILMTIVDISKECVDGKLRMVFHASRRRKEENKMSPVHMARQNNSMLISTWTGNADNDYIALDPRGGDIGPALFDGQTHCMHDNRRITRHLIKNWQVTEFARALDADMESKGEKIWDFGTNEFVEINRIDGPPSATYVELIWDDMLGQGPKRIMAKREKALRFASLKEPLTMMNKYELVLPMCDLDTFRCIYDFINKDGYLATPAEKLLHWPLKANGHRQPPILLRQDSSLQTSLIAPDVSIITHVKVFKAAEAIKFEELMTRALEQMNCVPVTSEDPIHLLRELYNDDLIPAAPPIHAELHRWARKFLARRDDGGGGERQRAGLAGLGLAGGGGGGGSKDNLSKILAWYGREFVELYHRNVGFREDANLARFMAMSGETELDALTGRRRAFPRQMRGLPGFSARVRGGGGGLGGPLSLLPGGGTGFRSEGLRGLLTEECLDDEVDALGGHFGRLGMLDAPLGRGGERELLLAALDCDPLGLGRRRDGLSLEELLEED